MKSRKQKIVEKKMAEASARLEAQGFVVVPSYLGWVDNTELLLGMNRDKNLIIGLPWLPGSMNQILNHQLGMFPGQKGFLILGRKESPEPRLLMNAELRKACKPS